MNPATDTASAWTLIDLAFMLGLFLALAIGVFRGFVAQVMALAGWLVAWLAARWFGPDLARLVPVGDPGSRTNELSGMAVAFVLALVLWALLTWVASQMVKASPLSAVDRLLGAGFGVAQFGVISLLVYTVFSLTPLGGWEPWTTSRVAPWLGSTLEVVKPVLPQKVVEHLPPPPSAAPLSSNLDKR